MRSILFMLMVPGLLVAQAPVTAGAKVRLRQLAEGETRREGVVTTARADSAVVEFHPNRRAWGFATATVPYTRLDVSLGQRRQAPEGVAIGIVVGALTGAALGAAAIAKQGHYVPESGAYVGGALGAVAGGVIGFRIGYQRRVERWKPILDSGR